MRDAILNYAGGIQLISDNTWSRWNYHTQNNLSHDNNGAPFLMQPTNRSLFVIKVSSHLHWRRELPLLSQVVVSLWRIL